mmetsp:Transcript_8629/g.25924  ORF Transcript_8629/g.25924 Transcript_8629/m.25924 type:complete len:330 (-) Transcript_8629:169-1158(-)
MCVLLLLCREMFPILVDESLRVDKPAESLCFLLGHVLVVYQVVHDEVGNANSGRARAIEEEAVLAEVWLDVGHAQCAKDARECDGRSSLYVIVETTALVHVVVQETGCICVCKVLKLDQCVRCEPLLDCRDKLVDKLVVLFAPDAVHVLPKVLRVVADEISVASRVQHDWQGVLGINAAAPIVQEQLPDRDAHAPGTEVAQAENSLPIRYDDDPNVVLGPVFEHLCHASLVLFYREPHATAAGEDLSVLLTGLADDWGVDDGHELDHVVHDDAEEQALISEQDVHEVDVLVQGAVKMANVLQVALRLELLWDFSGRQEPLQPIFLPLRL